MSIETKKVDDWFGVWNGFSCEFVNPAYLGISEEEIRDYTKDNPFPNDPEYSLEDCIHDITGSEGSYIIPTTTRDTADYIAEMISQLI